MDSENCVKLVESWKAGGGVLTVDGTQLTAVLADWLAGWLTGATLGRFNNGARFTHDDTRVPTRGLSSLQPPSPRDHRIFVDRNNNYRTR